MAYLTLVYLTKVSKADKHVAVQLVAKRLRGFDFAKFKVEESFFLQNNAYFLNSCFHHKI